ncbi:hypothetical protein E4U57_006543 [Claviceps arundinis]|uniref:Uncharacterized protein n=1 Tax=Claviceps arundinis TaxID=1623583 RepID=A0A9P7MQZ7_9HYPO|nr:hypothetical protein E4U57_006543 [Claviceps arundinis]KAG5964702.1 hypothetical protein E4U56_002093 [Claviceps arundinis]
MRSSFVFFGLVAVALANLNQNANEMRDVSDVEGSKVEADPPTKMIATMTKYAVSKPTPGTVETTAKEEGPDTA